MITVGHGGLCGWQWGEAWAGLGAGAAASLAGRPGKTLVGTGDQWESWVPEGQSQYLL